MPPVAKKSTAARSAAAIRAVVGSDESEVKRHARQLAGEMAPAEAGDLGCEVIDGMADNADQAVARIHQTIEALLTMPFFGGEKLVWLKNANFVGESVASRAASVLEALEKLTATLESALPGGIRFLLSAPDIDKKRTFYKSLGKVAEMAVFDRLDLGRSGWEEQAGGIVRERAQALGLKLRGEALELFVQLTGGDSRQIDNELEKLDLYLGEARREVTAADVRLMVPMSRAGVVFELGNALAARDLRQALALVDQLLFQGETPIAILLVAIIPTVRNLLMVKDLMQRYRLSRPAVPFHFVGTLNRLPAEATDHLPRKKDGTVSAYALGIAATGAHRFDMAGLQAALEKCLEANVAVVTGAVDPRTVLTELVVQIASGQ